MFQVGSCGINDIIFSIIQIKKWSSKNNKKPLFCLWMSRDPDEETENYGAEKHRQLLASFNSTMNVSTGNFQEVSIIFKFYILCALYIILS